jgi:hypothetical protein
MAKKEWIKVDNLPSYVEKVRNKRNINQQQVADAVAVTQPQISRTENPDEDEGVRLTLINDILVMIAGTAIDFDSIRVPVRAATPEDHEAARERMEERLNGEYIDYPHPKIRDRTGR